jgi:hypothetical protein
VLLLLLLLLLLLEVFLAGNPEFWPRAREPLLAFGEGEIED